MIYQLNAFYNDDEFEEIITYYDSIEELQENYKIDLFRDMNERNEEIISFFVYEMIDDTYDIIRTLPIHEYLV